MHGMSIGEAARKLGLRPSTFRYAEAKNIRDLLNETVQRECPKLARRGCALSDPNASASSKGALESPSHHPRP